MIKFLSYSLLLLTLWNCSKECKVETTLDSKGRIETILQDINCDPLQGPEEVTYNKQGGINKIAQNYLLEDSSVVKSFFDNGKLRRIMITTNKGRFKEVKKFYDNDQLQSTQQFIDLKRNGTYFEWYSTGELRKQLVFENDSLIDQIVFKELEEDEK